MDKEWKLVLDPHRGGYAKGFDRDAIYEFRRSGSDDVERFRMSDQSGFFNVADLYYRENPNG